ncbi:hypothetical protein MNBD_GAMMA01-2269 [hydrothermal vent metagenome]|uniref:Uncharacterized protein n=1 Tax=hydrothermal vent metagenome TaxID=652676 RepID=A0A3B0VEU5_9ZZZZ
MIGLIISLVGGSLAAASLIVKMKPDAKNLIDKLTPYQGIVGLVLLGWGLWSAINIVRGLLAGSFDVVSVVGVVVQLLVGFLLSFGLLSQFLFSKSEAAKEKGQALRLKLAGYQGVLGLVLIGLSVWGFIGIL